MNDGVPMPLDVAVLGLAPPTNPSAVTAWASFVSNVLFDNLRDGSAARLSGAGRGVGQPSDAFAALTETVDAGAGRPPEFVAVREPG